MSFSTITHQKHTPQITVEYSHIYTIDWTRARIKNSFFSLLFSGCCCCCYSVRYNIYIHIHMAVFFRCIVVSYVVYFSFVSYSFFFTILWLFLSFWMLCFAFEPYLLRSFSVINLVSCVARLLLFNSRYLRFVLCACWEPSIRLSLSFLEFVYVLFSCTSDDWFSCVYGYTMNSHSQSLWSSSSSSFIVCGLSVHICCSLYFLY